VLNSLAEDFISDLSKEFDLRLGLSFDKEKANCSWFTQKFFEWSKLKNQNCQVIYFPHDEEAHIAPYISGKILDFTIKQFTKNPNNDFKITQPEDYVQWGYTKFEIYDYLPEFLTIREADKKKIFESVDSDLEDIKDIVNDISDLEEIGIYIEEDSERIKINIFPEKGGYLFFKVNQNIKSVIQRLNHIYKNEYMFLYQYDDGRKWTKFYVYDDERGLRDSNTVRLDGTGKFPAPQIYKMQIVMIK